ncbi:MAG: FxLYD domain-containing protein [Gemmatimonadota bacterium]
MIPRSSMRRPARRATALLCLALGPGCSGADGADADRPGASTAQAAASAAGGVTARGASGQYDLGDYFLYGEVVNGLDVPIYDVELGITYLDSAGTTLATDEGGVVLARVEPRSTAPFVDTHYGAPEGIRRAAVTATKWATESRLEYRPVTILDDTAYLGVSGVVVTGRVRNDAGGPLSAVKLVASFRNRAGEVVGVFFDYPLIGAMQPGRTVDFTIETIDETIADAAVRVQGEGTLDK